MFANNARAELKVQNIIPVEVEDRKETEPKNVFTDFCFFLIPVLPESLKSHDIKQWFPASAFTHCFPRFLETVHSKMH